MSVRQNDDGTLSMEEPLVCALCLYVEDGRVAAPAITVIEGYAVCEDHLGYVAQGERFHRILTAVRGESAGDSGERT